MYYTGFADEAGKDIDTQIQATRELGWSCIEARNIDGVNITDIPEERFEEVAGKLSAAGIGVNCFGSAVANWGKDALKQEDFDRSAAELSRAIPRMKKLGTRMIRGMSFAIARDTAPDSPEVEREVFRKVSALVRMCEEGGVLYLHENCMNYGGLSFAHTLKLIDAVRSPNFALVFDTGNPVSSIDRRGRQPYGLQSAWEFYRNVKQFIRYVHVKDAMYVGPAEGVFPKTAYTWPGEGKGDVRMIVEDLLKNGYDGGFSIEPHMGSVSHEDAPYRREDGAYRTYVEYGKRFMKLVEEIAHR
jgi:sugar phosphate isomerase/epimerase